MQERYGLIPMKILGKPTSINVRKVLWTCVELGLTVELEPWGSGHRDTQAPEFLALNPNAMVPVLRDGDLVLWESNTICRYLAGREQRADLLPVEPGARARVEQWMDWQATELNNSWRYAFMSLVRQSPAHQDRVALQAGIAGWHHHMGILDAQLQKTGAYAAGSQFTLADVVLGLSAQRWLMAPLEQGRRPELRAVRAWLQHLNERPGFRLHGANGMP